MCWTAWIMLVLCHCLVVPGSLSEKAGEYDMRQFYKKFNDDIKGRGKLWCIGIGSPTCPHCSALKPTFMAMSEEFREDPRIEFAYVYLQSVNVHQMLALQENLGVWYGIPYVVLYRDKVLTQYNNDQGTSGLPKVEDALEQLKDLPEHTARQISDVIPITVTKDAELTGDLRDQRNNDAFISACSFGSRQYRIFDPLVSRQLDGFKFESMKNWNTMLMRLWPEDDVLKSLVECFDGIEAIIHENPMNGTKLRQQLISARNTIDEWCIEPGEFRFCATENCGLWTLFHMLTVNAFESGKNSLRIIRDVVHHFLECKECKKHFVNAFDADAESISDTEEDAAMWLWKVHNDASIRHKRNDYPNWPRKAFCPNCWKNTTNQNENLANHSKQHIFEYLKKAYGLSGGPQGGTPSRNTKKPSRARSWWTWNKVLLAIGLPAVLLIMGAFGICCYMRWRRARDEKIARELEEEDVKHIELRVVMT